MSSLEDPIKDLSSIYNNNFDKGGMNNISKTDDNPNDFTEGNYNELPLSKEDEFNDADFENQGLGLVMDVRSTTFRDLTEMIPRGYGEMGDITKKEEEIITNERANFDVASSSSPSHDPLEEMKIRNQEKWAQLGYDPKAGRGNMKMSITLSNFKLSTFLENSNFSSNKSNIKCATNSLMEFKPTDLNKNLTQNQQPFLSSLPENSENSSNSYSTQVLQSYSMCIKPQKQIPRVNSSNNPSTFIEAESNSDEMDESEHHSSDNAIPAVELNTTNLLASFQPLEEDLQNPDQTEATNYSDNNVQNESDSTPENTESNNSSSELASNSVSDSQTLESNSSNNNEEKVHIDNKSKNFFQSSSKETSKIVIPKSPNSLNSSSTPTIVSEEKSSSDKNSKTSKPSTAQSQLGYDYSAYDDPNFDYEAASKNIPPDLLKIINYPKTGIVFRALCGQSMLQYPRGVSQYVIADLKIILDKCVYKNMINESTYVSSIIDSIKTENMNRLSNKKLKYNEERCTEAAESLSKKQQYWENQKNILNSEKEVKLQEIELKYQDELDNLEMLWNSDKKRLQFNKPSAQLITLRQSVQANLAAKRFQEAAQLATRAEKLDKAETEHAAQRMRQAYSDAAYRLKQKYESERKALYQQFESKKSALIAQEEADLRPAENRIQKYNNSNNQQDLTSSTTQDTSTAAARRSISVMSTASAANYGPIIKKPVIKAPKVPTQANAKLKLPLLKPNPQPIYKGSSSSSLNQINL